MRFGLLVLYSMYLTDDIDKFILELDNLKIKLIKENLIPEFGCFGTTID